MRTEKMIMNKLIGLEQELQNAIKCGCANYETNYYLSVKIEMLKWVLNKEGKRKK